MFLSGDREKPGENQERSGESPGFSREKIYIFNDFSGIRFWGFFEGKEDFFPKKMKKSVQQVALMRKENRTEGKKRASLTNKKPNAPLLLYKKFPLQYIFTP